MNLRDVARSLLPYGAVQAIRRHNKGILGHYRTWEEAMRSTGPYKPDVETLTETVRRYRDGQPCYLNRYDSRLKTVSYPLLAGLLMAATRSDNRLAVLDFGGSLGQSWFSVRQVLRHLRPVVWCVVDLPECVERGKQVFESDQLRFFESVDAATSRFDLNVVVCSSALQYLDAPYETLAMLANLGISHLIIDRTPFASDDAERYMRQYTPPDMGGDTHPIRILARSGLEDALGDHYILQLDHSYGDFPLDGDRASYRGLVYFRSPPSCATSATPA